MKYEARPVADERVTQETTKIMAQNFWTETIALAALLAVKIVMAVRGDAWIGLLPELVTLAVGFVSLLIQWTKRGLWGAKDERTRGEAVAALYMAWRHMVAVLCGSLFVMIVMGVEKEACYLTILVDGLVFGLQERRMVKAGIYHEQGEQTTGKSVAKEIVSIGVFGLVAVPLGSLLKGEMAPWWVFVLSPVVFMIFGLFAVGSTWVHELVSEQNADEAVQAAERRAEGSGDDEA